MITIWRKSLLCSFELMMNEFPFSCEECANLTDALRQLRLLIERTQSIPHKLRSRLLYRMDFNSNLILEWKMHQLRTVHQENAREQALEQLDHDSVYVHMDWSMKFLPLKYREKMNDWFGKRGLSWHITYVIRLRQSSSTSPNDRGYEHRSYVHVFNNCQQNARAVVAILADVFKRLRSENDRITKASVCSDNAGCFHGNFAILASTSMARPNGYFLVQERIHCLPFPGCFKRLACLSLGSISVKLNPEKAHATGWPRRLKGTFVAL